MVSNSTPNLDPSNINSLTGVLKVALDRFLRGVDDMIPAEVVSFDRTTNTAKVHPLIQSVTTDGEIIKRADIESVPVFRFSGGGVVYSINLNAGDIGWLKANDRDISIFKQNGKEAIPNTKRKHNFSDAVFIPDIFTGITIPAAHINHATVQTPDGSSCAAWLTQNTILQLDSTTKGFCLPRMTTAQRNAIPNPYEGLTIWNTDTHGAQSYYLGWP